MQLKKYLRLFASYIVKKDKRRFLGFCLKLINKTGLEIGGPSGIFKPQGFFPVYFFAKRVDVVNFSSETIWEGSIAEGLNYQYYKNKKGYQYIDEASELNKIKKASYDFVLSSHSLEHVANPIKAILEWKRVLKQRGILILVLPNKESTFDHKRNFTTFEHLLQDYENEVHEDDSTHFEEVIELHDISKDQGVKDLEEFKKRTSLNYNNRCIHHHVFSFSLIRRLLEYSGFSIIDQRVAYDFHLVTIARINN